MEEAEKSMSITKDKITNYDVSLRKINISEHNESNINADLIKKFTFSRYVSLFRQDFDMQNLEKWSELICQKSPKRRCYHVSFIHKDFLYVFAGMDINEGKMNDLFRVNLNLNSENFLKWEEVTVSGTHPSELSYLQGALDAEGGKFYIFGGENIYQRYPNDLFILDIEKKTFTKKTFDETIIPGMTGHTLNYHPETHSLVLFGGFAKGAYMNAVYIYEIEANSWTKLNAHEINNNSNNEINESSENNNINNRLNTNNTYKDANNSDYPCGRMLHAATIFNDYLHVFGGKTGDGIYLNDFWRFSLFSKTWDKIKVEGEVPKGRSGHTMVNNENCIYIFGGKVGDLQERNEFWKFDAEKNYFSIIHDTMLEQHVDSQNDISIAYKDYSKKVTRKMGKTISNRTNDQFITESQSKPKEQQIKGKKKNMNNNTNIEQKYEEMILLSPNTKKMKNSMIYKLEGTGANVLKSKVSIYISEKNTLSGVADKIRSGIVPAPRDGHTMNVYNNMIIIFGGDRNKFPYNDLFTYNLNN